jgi:Domain of unknown function (DUF5710)
MPTNYLQQTKAQRIYLNVPYSQKDTAKSLGARWDQGTRRWFVPSKIPIDQFNQWLPVKRPSKPTQQQPRLTIKLVPKSCWYSNVRSEVTPQSWELLKKRTFKAANYRCEICGGQGNQHPVECHEVWDYDDVRHIQRLVRLIALCPACHECKHIGFANVRGRGDIAAAHLASVNQWSAAVVSDYIGGCFKLWERRSQFKWDLDISCLESLSVGL